jgi:GNAT superfamily N-acetyltransferase
MRLIHTKSIRKYKNIFEGLVQDFGYIYYSSILYYCGILDKNKDPDQYVGFWKIWLIVVDDIIGICGLYALKSTEELWLGWFGIIPEYRYKGLGTKVLARLENKAKKRGAKRLFVYVDKNEKAIPFYKRNGFELVGRVGEYVKYHNISMDDFEDENDMVMVKHLK